VSTKEITEALKEAAMWLLFAVAIIPMTIALIVINCGTKEKEDEE
jgi:hypothetical protein